MFFSLLAQLCVTVIDLLRIAHLSTDEKDIEILILHLQLDVLARKQTQAVKPSRQEKWSLAVLASDVEKVKLPHNEPTGLGPPCLQFEDCHWRASGTRTPHMETKTSRSWRQIVDQR